MKIQLLTIAAISLTTSTVSAFSCPSNPTHTISETCWSTLLEAANCNCKAYASVASGNCWGSCQLAGKYRSNCITGCANELSAEKKECQRIYDDFKQNEGGLDWVVEMGVKSAGLCYGAP
ncbi:hypothetical protein BGZ97_005956 [Linnemannia gamsii]|uniref:Extracellular membrane protein CFEM domain-containing protein n=1 Tax=Linnemannia gamsii TaxID=64522 RepID=A0A9P6UG20_9FUNG|nr:hypothetical protein BGZ97_005956 [Linnemannia gamsii]